MPPFFQEKKKRGQENMECGEFNYGQGKRHYSLQGLLVFHLYTKHIPIDQFVRKVGSTCARINQLTPN